MADFFFPEHWPLPKGVHAAFSLRTGGHSSAPYDSNNLGLHVEDNPLCVQRNREKLTKELGVQQVQWLNQVHGNDACQALADGNTPDADACFTQESNLACAVLTADCLPVLFCDTQGTQVAAAHAGWRGLASGVLLNTLATFKTPSDVIVYLGPAIGPDEFEVGPEVRAAFPWASEHCFKQGKADRLLANLYLLAQEQLEAAGVQTVHSSFSKNNPSATAWCTVRQPQQFFSYRRDGITGRMASLIWRSLV